MIDEDEIEKAVREAICFLSMMIRLGWIDGNPRWKHLTPEEETEIARATREQSTIEDVLCDAARSKVESLPGHMMTKLQRSFISFVLRDWRRLSKIEDRESRKTAVRDAFIIMFVRRLVDRGFHRERSHHVRPDHRPSVSACSIVARACAELDVNLSERTIEDICSRPGKKG